MAAPSTSRDPDPAFVTTRWTLVLRARGRTPESALAMRELCETYYGPVLAFIRRKGFDADSARDLSHEFLQRVLVSGFTGADPARGSFRSYLLGAVKHFLADARDRQRALRRGGGQSLESLDAGVSAAETAEMQVPDPAGPASDHLFDREWALTVVERSVSTLAAELELAGKSREYAVLKPWLVGELPGISQAEAGRQLGLTEGAVKVLIHRMRKRFRELVTAELSQTVADPAEVPEELSYLIQVLSGAK